MCDQPPKQAEDFTRHPAFILILGALLTSVVFPLSTWFITDRRLAAEARRAKAREILEFNTSISRQVNSICTRFSLFEKDVLADPLADKIFPEMQKDLRKDIYTLYHEFDSTAWWGLQNTTAEIRVARLLGPDEINTLQRCADDFSGNLSQTMDQLSVAWTTYLNAAGIPPPEDRAKMNLTDPALKRLHAERAAIVSKAVSLLE